MNAKQLDGRVKRFLSETISGDEPALLGVSGGPDSTALAASVHAAGYLENLRLVHVDHGLRPNDEPEERRICEELARRLDRPLDLLKAGVSPDKPASHGLEAAARDARMRCFRQAAESHGATAILLGHTLDDQAETVLLRVLRGTGIAGLAAMTGNDPTPWSPSVRLLRPLLDTPRDATRAYCEERGLRFADDPSNQDRRFTRNRIRLDLLPKLIELNPGAIRHLSGLATDAGAVARYFDDAAATTFAEIGTISTDAVEVDRTRFLELSAPLQPWVIASAWRAAYPEAEPLSRRLVTACVKAAATTGTRVSLPNGREWLTDYESVRLGNRDEARPDSWPPVNLLKGSVVDLGRWRLSVDAGAGGDRAYAESFDARVLDEGIIARRWEPGDRLALKGGQGHSKLQDLFVNAKVPRDRRLNWPVVAAEGGAILWIPGIKRSRHFPALPGRDAVRITAELRDD